MSVSRAKKAPYRGASRAVSQRTAPRQLSARLRLGMKVTAVLGICTGLAFAAHWAAPRLSPPVEQVVLEGDFRWLQESHVREVVSQNLDAGLLAVDIRQLREQIRQVPWVEQVEISRQFPASLVVSVVEERPIARWNDRGYISQQGEFIESELHEELSSLPHLSSELQTVGVAVGAAEAIDIYHLLNSAVSVSGQSIRELRQDTAGGWTMIWASGLEIDLGRSDHLKRVRHALAAWTRMSAKERQAIAVIDARYDNGVAVRRASDGQRAQKQEAAKRVAKPTDNPV